MAAALTIMVVAATALVPRTALADPRQDPAADYSADVVAKVEGEPDGSSKLWNTKDKVRIDIVEDGETMVVIMERTAKRMTILLPRAKAYRQESMPDGGASNPMSSGTWRVARAGEEVLEGVPTTKWQVSGKGADGRGFTGFVWTTKENIQVKMEGVSDEEGKKTKVSSVLSNLKVGPIDPSMFAIPADYKPMPKD